MRVLREDLRSDWSNVEQKRAVENGLVDKLPSLSDIGHPLVSHLRAICRADSLTMDPILGLSNPQWWKVKTTRWRGAAWIDDAEGEVWLCAGGIRRDGDNDDFYVQFTARAADNPDQFLPSEEDRKHLRRERLHSQLYQWKRDVSSIAVQAFAAATSGTGNPSRYVIPALGASSLLEIVVTVVPEDGSYWIEVEFPRIDRSKQPLAATAEREAQLAICPYEDRWNAGSDAAYWILASSETDLQQLLAEAQDFAGTPRAVIPVSESHYTTKNGLTESTINGSAVMSLCGLWFVPRQDHALLPICDVCQAANRFASKRRGEISQG